MYMCIYICITKSIPCVFNVCASLRLPSRFETHQHVTLTLRCGRSVLKVFIHLPLLPLHILSRTGRRTLIGAAASAAG